MAVNMKKFNLGDGSEIQVNMTLVRTSQTYKDGSINLRFDKEHSIDVKPSKKLTPAKSSKTPVTTKTARKKR